MLKIFAMGRHRTWTPSPEDRRSSQRKLAADAFKYCGIGFVDIKSSKSLSTQLNNFHLLQLSAQGPRDLSNAHFAIVFCERTQMKYGL
jgi:hypothetical protein